MEVNEAAPKYYPRMSPLEFLQWERGQEYKHEYVKGEIISMAGASVNHNKILSNIIGRTWNHLQGKQCNIYPSDLRIAVKSKNSFFYPDATILMSSHDKLSIDPIQLEIRLEEIYDGVKF